MTWSYLGIPLCASPNLVPPSAVCASPNFDSKHTLEDHVRGIVSRASQRIYIFEVRGACLGRHLCVTSLLLCIICSLNPCVLFAAVGGPDAECYLHLR